MSVPRLVPALTIALTILILPVYGQINTPCNPSLITSLTPCMNFITNSSANGTSPTFDCCNSLNALTASSKDCFCLIVTGNVPIPFQIPINRTLAISLPRACNMPGVPLQCKASASPLPAPGPALLGPTVSPRAAPSPSPIASSIPTITPPTLAPASDTTQDSAPTSPTVDSDAPTTNTGIRPVLTPSAAKPSYSLSPSLMLFVSGVLVMKYY